MITLVIAILVVLVLLFLAAYITNPFNRFTIIKRPFIVEILKDTVHAVNNNHRIQVKQSRAWKAFALVKRGIHIVSARYTTTDRTKGLSVESVIADIHQLRFDPKKLLLITGDHFNDLFVRNLGVFYYPTLDPRLPSSKEDWHNRQIVYLQTTAYALGVFDKYRIPATTIVSTGPYLATCINLYSYPSDTVYGLLYALSALAGKEPTAPIDYRSDHHHKLSTHTAARILLHEYRTCLAALYSHYRDTAFDEASGLISKHLHLSGAKDITRRRSSFYDNVIFWKTTELAMKLGIVEKDKDFLAQLKQRILRTFWLEDKGHFLEDLSVEGLNNSYYSSEWLIVLITGFLNPTSKEERSYFERCIKHIQANGIDKPFALKYHNDRRAHRQFWAVRMAVPAYGGDAIWSFWGMEYIKVLLILYRETKDAHYLDTADFHINAYRAVMVQYNGFPEVYNAKGQLLQTAIYKSVQQTSWVVGFEQVLAMRHSIQA